MKKNLAYNVQTENEYHGKEQGGSIAPFLWMRGESREVIREELDKISECHIRSICVESRPHPDFLGDGWWADMDFIMEEAKKRDMKVWLLDDAHFPTGYADGWIKSRYPERKKKYINYNVIDVWGYQEEVSLNIDEAKKPMRGWSQRVSKEIMEQEKANEVLSVIAFRLAEDNRVDERSCLDLTGRVEDGQITYRFPDGAWRVFVIYRTDANPANGGNPDYINMLDRDSVHTLIEAVYEPHYQHYKEEFGRTFQGFFSDEPGFGNTSGFAKDERIGHKDMPLPWSAELEEQMERDYPGEWKQYLPFLWMPSVQMDHTVSFRRYYMDAVTRLYEKNFSQQLGQWCEQRNVRYIGHVIEDSGQHTRLGCGAGHYFRAMSGQHMAGIDTIGTQIMMGGGHYRRSNIARTDGKFFHYTLAKLAASSAALDRNKHGMSMCELFGAYGWELRLRDMKWIADHLLVNGINFFVPHAFSMAEYPDFDCPPHFYARGNNPQTPCFAELMKYVGEMAEIFQGGRPVVNTAVLYHAEAEWMGEYMPVDDVACRLASAQISYLFVSADHILQAEKDGTGFSVNGIHFDRLVIPYCEYLPGEILEKLSEIGAGNILMIGNYPKKTVVGKKVRRWEPNPEIRCCGLGELAGCIRRETDPDVRLETEFPDLRYYHYCKNGKDIYFFHNESVSDTYSGVISVQGESGEFSLTAALPPYGTLLLSADKDGVRRHMKQDAADQDTKGIDISTGWNISSCRAIDYPKFTAYGTMDELIPFSRVMPDFAGVIAYEKVVEAEADGTEGAVFTAEDICDGAQIFVNGKLAGTVYAPPYSLEIGHLMQPGENTIRVEVRTTLEREQKKFGGLSFAKMLLPQNPTGMFGRIRIVKTGE